MNCVQNPDLINFIRRLNFLGLVRYEVSPKGRREVKKKICDNVDLKRRKGGGRDVSFKS